MFVHMAIHRPHPDKAHLMLDSMRRFGAAMQGASGLREVHQLQDEETGALIGLAIWDSKEDMLKGVGSAREAIKDDDHAAWEPNPPEVFRLNPA